MCVFTYMNTYAYIGIHIHTHLPHIPCVVSVLGAVGLKKRETNSTLKILPD